MTRGVKYCLSIFVVLFTMVVLCGNSFIVKAESGQEEISGTYYEMKDNKNYIYSECEPVNQMSYGKKAVGKLLINGVDVEEYTYKGSLAFGATGNVSFSYVYDQSLINAGKTQWHLVEDKEKKVAGRKLDVNVGNGVLIIQKSVDGQNYEDVANPMVDFFTSNTSGVELYKTSGEDMATGMYYRFIFAYKTAIQDGKVLFVPTTTYKRHVEVYEFFVVENSGQISIHNLSVDEELLELEGYSQELLKHGETLTNGSVTRDGFSVEKITSSYNVKVARNGGIACLTDDNDKFTTDGKYTITVETLLGKKVSTEVYVFSGGEDKGYETYFSTSPVQAERVFREGAYPTYARGGRILLQAVDVAVPVLYGSVKEMLSGTTVYELNGTREEQYVELLPGEYEATFYNGKGDVAGSFYRYSFKFTVIDEESAPYVNYQNLLVTERLEDLVTKHYEVAYQTTGGGYIYVCFAMDSYEKALMYAREIEGRFVETASDGGYYYKSIENANRKIKYYDLAELTKAREHYAKLNVEVNYFNPLDEFTHRTYNNDLLSCLEELSITESIKVFPSQEEKEKMLERKPYINNFTFIQVSDYDVATIEACHKETGEIKTLSFDVPVSAQLGMSGTYSITETNCYGKSSVYDVYYLAECETQMNWIIEKDGAIENVSVTKSSMDDDNALIILADSAYVTEISNSLDPWAIVTIKAPGVYSFEIKCLATEFKNLEFYKAGEYEITFIDRLGNCFTVKLAITGETAYDALEACNTSYVTFYNGLYINPQNTEEDILQLSEIEMEKNDSLLEEDAVISESDAVATVTPTPAQDKTDNDVSTEEPTGNGIIFLIISVVIALAIVAVIILMMRKKQNEENAHEE